MKTHITKYFILSFCIFFTIACEKEPYNISSRDFFAGISTVSVINQIGSPVIVTTSTVEIAQGLESKVTFNMNKLTDFKAIKISQLVVSDSAKAYYKDTLITNQTVFSSDSLSKDLISGVETWSFPIKVVSKNGNVRNWSFYLKSSPPPNLQFDGATTKTFDYYGQQKFMGEILVAGLTNVGDGKWSYSVSDVTQWGPQLAISNKGVMNSVVAAFDMSDDYIIFHSNGTYEYSYGANAVSMAQYLSTHQQYYIPKGKGEWSLSTSTVKPALYKITLYNYDTKQNIILDGVNFTKPNNAYVLDCGNYDGSNMKLQIRLWSKKP